MNKLYEESSIQAIANAIRSKNGSSDTYTVSQMATAILNIPSSGGGTNVPNFPINNDKNNFWVVIKEPNTSVSITGSGTIDWGDETIDTNTSHTYSHIGMYCIQGSGIINYNYQLFAEYNTGNSISSYTNNLNIEKAKINNQITTIDNNTFNGCVSLTSVNLPNTVTSIGYNAFYSCASLVNINLPNTITNINHNAFNGCSSLTNINLSNVQEIQPGAFGSCTSLSGHLDISKATLTGYRDSSDNGAFMGCTGITSVTIGAVEPYDSSKRNAAFKNCTGLTTATILGGTSTGRGTFGYCSALRTVYLPDTITEIGYYCFEYDRNLTLYIRATTPPTILSNAFSGASVFAIYVPAESVETYQTATGWSTYASKIQAEPTT